MVRKGHPLFISTHSTPPMKPIVLDPARYKKLLRFATASGDLEVIGTILGTVDDNVIAAYLEELKDKDHALWKKWGSQWQPEGAALPPQEGEAGPAPDPFDDDDEDDLIGESAPPPAPVVARPAVSRPKVTVSVAADGEGIVVPPGVSTAIPERFRLRQANGTDIALEVFSRGKFGYILRVPVPTDMRTVLIKGKSVEVDLLALRRDPAGITGGVANSKLIAAAELQ